MPLFGRPAHAAPVGDRSGPDLLVLYGAMARARPFELLLLQLWQEGLVSGEPHLGTGEKAIAAGLTPHLQEGDALALDHRCEELARVDAAVGQEMREIRTAALGREG